MRLDIYLFECGYADSRSEAKGFITSGAVWVNRSVVTKPSYDVVDGDIVNVDKSGKRFVSRGGVKLEAALDNFGINVNGRLALDIGASSGGFTDCLLKRGAEHVIAVDSGFGQMSKVLLADRRVTSYENYNARYMIPSDLKYVPSLVVMDVSFISATRIIPAVYRCIETPGDFVCLIKPQFEVGRGGVGKGGIVKDARRREDAVDAVIEFAKGCGFVLAGLMESPITGGDGNVEFLAHFTKEATDDTEGNNRTES